MSVDDPSKYVTNISSAVIDDAVRSVQRHTAPAEEGAAQAGDPALLQELESVKAQLELSQTKGRELMEKIKDTHERMVRAVADLDNYRKRAQKEKEEVSKFGIEKLLRDCLPVVDNLDRALEHARGSTDFESLKKGLEMTRKLFGDALGKHGVKTFSAVGLPFDPRLHEAMQQVESDEVPPNQVLMELVRGYMLNDRLMRPALVCVATPSSAARAAAQANPAPAPVAPPTDEQQGA
jgi:molecular chaperone GrpE